MKKTKRIARKTQTCQTKVEGHVIDIRFTLLGYVHRNPTYAPTFGNIRFPDVIWTGRTFRVRRGQSCTDRYGLSHENLCDFGRYFSQGGGQ